MRPLLLLLLWAAPALAGPGRDPGNIGGRGPQRPREGAGAAQARLEAALAALRSERQAAGRPQAGVPMPGLMERAAQLRAALDELPPALDEASQHQRLLLYALTATVETLGAMGDPAALDVAETLLRQGSHVTRNDAALVPPAVPEAARPLESARPQTPPAVAATPPQGPSPGDVWAATPAGAEAVARAQADPAAARRGADLGKMNALSGKAARAIGGAFDTKSLGGLGGGLGGGAGGGAMGSLGRAGGAFGASGAPRPPPTTVSSPADVAALGVAAAGAGHGAFADLGLKMGTAPDGRSQVQRLDGSPATESDMTALRGRLGTEPEALMKRPDFFRVLSRDALEALKGRYRSEPGGPWFQDMTLKRPAERDFVWDSACDKVSGDCNPLAREPGYKRGEHVAPETLVAVSSAVERADAVAEAEPGYQGFRAPRSAGYSSGGSGGEPAAPSVAGSKAKLAAAGFGLLLLLLAAAALALRRDAPAG